MPEWLPLVYRQAFDEYRAEVALNWDRQKFFLTLNVAIVAAAASILRINQGQPVPRVVAVLLCMGICLAVLGFIVVEAGHRRYRATRDVFQAIEKQLALPAELRIQTTEGMRGQPHVGLTSVRITTVTKIVLGLFAIGEMVSLSLVLR